MAVKRQKLAMNFPCSSCHAQAKIAVEKRTRMPLKVAKLETFATSNALHCVAGCSPGQTDLGYILTSLHVKQVTYMSGEDFVFAGSDWLDHEASREKLETVDQVLVHSLLQVYSFEVQVQATRPKMLLP